jgi:hypothetical protein
MDAAAFCGAPWYVRSRLHRGRALLADRLRHRESVVHTPANGLIV